MSNWAVFDASGAKDTGIHIDSVGNCTAAEMATIGLKYDDLHNSMVLMARYLVFVGCGHAVCVSYRASRIRGNLYDTYWSTWAIDGEEMEWMHMH